MTSSPHQTSIDQSRMTIRLTNGEKPVRDMIRTMLLFRYLRKGFISLLILLIAEQSTADTTNGQHVQALLGLAKDLGVPNLWSQGSGDPCTSSWVGVTCASGNAIVGLTLTGRGLRGTLSSVIGQLDGLQTLNISDNELHGPIPKEIGDLPSLVNLDLSFNAFSGDIPETLGDLHSLRILNLAGNNLRGPIPLNLFNLTDLQTLSLPHNPLGTIIPDKLERLLNLKALMLHNSSLIGEIPDSIGHLTNLVVILMGNNNLTGTLPDELSNLKELLVLAVNDNPLLGGDIPDLSSATQLFARHTGINLPPGSKTITDIMNGPAVCKLVPNVSCDCFAQPLEPRRRRGRVNSSAVVAAIVGGCGIGSFSALMICVVLVRRAKTGEKWSSRCFSWPKNRSGELDPITEGPLSELPIFDDGGFGRNRTPAHSVSANSDVPMVLSFNQLKDATENFRSDYLLGSGGSGYVYKGFINAEVCAVKVLKPTSKDVAREREFHAELDILSKMTHPNLIRLLGFCHDRDHRALVYEYMRNGSLDDQLHGVGKGHLMWHERLTIILGAARAIDYLHTGGGNKFSPVIHRDLKSSNILLDDELGCKISDLGIAKLIPRDQTRTATTGVLGTLGYVAPEYFHTGLLSRKSDIYNLGVVILEAMTGRRPVEVIQMPRSTMHLVYWARLQLRDRKKVAALLDTSLVSGTFSEKSVFKVAGITARCLAEEPDLRPSAGELLKELESAHKESSLFQSRLMWGRQNHK